LTNDPWATFDCYGTLIDWNGGLAEAMSALWRETNGQHLLRLYHGLEPLIQQGRSIPYRAVLARSLKAVAAIEDLPLEASQQYALADSLPRWPAFPETATALRSLRNRGWKLGILSNTDPDFLASSLLQIGVDVDVTITAADAGSYKPAHGHWHRFYETTSASPSRHFHVAASLFHDIAPARDLGIPAVWINRLNEQSDLPRAAELRNLTDLPQVLEDLDHQNTAENRPSSQA
jgi:2-haloacid dehalogenase